jgi:diacylglycerol kinase family enzyme
MAADAPAAPASARWLARLAILAGIACAVVVIVGGRSSMAVLAAGLAAVACVAAGGWWFLSHRGPVRWLAAALVVLAPLALLAFYLSRHLVWSTVVAVVLLLAAIAAARAALLKARPPAAMPERVVPPPVHPFVVMNPRSGGGKVGRFSLVERANALGAQVALLDGPGTVDVGSLAREAVAGGADLLGAAGGDGTQALVAGVAAEHDLPFLVISAGTRNHLALDLGLDRERPDLGVDALADGVELRIDLGMVAGRPFANNASFGAYAEIVQSPAYRDDKRATMLQMLPDLLAGHRGAPLTVTIDGTRVIEGPKAVLVSNNPYASGDLAGLGRRARLDTGRLGVVVVTVNSAAQAAGLLRGRHATGLSRFTAQEVVIDADVPEIPVGVDGEAVLLATPVRCSILPGALRVRLPRQRPGVLVPKPPLDRALFREQATNLLELARPGH